MTAQPLPQGRMVGFMGSGKEHCGLIITLPDQTDVFVPLSAWQAGYLVQRLTEEYEK